MKILLLSIMLISMSVSMAYGATYEKVNNSVVRIKKEVSQEKSVKELYQLKKALSKDILRKEREILDLENQINSIDKDIQEAQLIGCVADD